MSTSRYSGLSYYIPSFISSYFSSTPAPTANAPGVTANQGAQVKGGAVAVNAKSAKDSSANLNPRCPVKEFEDQLDVKLKELSDYKEEFDDIEEIIVQLMEQEEAVINKTQVNEETKLVESPKVELKSEVKTEAKLKDSPKVELKSAVKSDMSSQAEVKSEASLQTELKSDIKKTETKSTDASKSEIKTQEIKNTNTPKTETKQVAPAENKKLLKSTEKLLEEIIQKTNLAIADDLIKLKIKVDSHAENLKKCRAASNIVLHLQDMIHQIRLVLMQARLNNEFVHEGVKVGIEIFVTEVFGKLQPYLQGILQALQILPRKSEERTEVEVFLEIHPGVAQATSTLRKDLHLLKKVKNELEKQYPETILLYSQEDEKSPVKASEEAKAKSSDSEKSIEMRTIVKNSSTDTTAESEDESHEEDTLTIESPVQPLPSVLKFSTFSPKVAAKSEDGNALTVKQAKI